MNIVRSIMLCMTALAACTRQIADPADFVLRDAMVYTVDSTHPRAQAVVVDDGRIVYVGSSDSARAFVGPETEVLHLAGRMVLPGFQDTHVHPVSGGIELGQCDLNAATTLDDVRRVVSECGRRDPTAPWVRGGGWALPIFPDANPRRITTLHEASATEPIALAYARADSLGRLTARSIVSLLVNTDAPVDSEAVDRWSIGIRISGRRTETHRMSS